MASDTNEIITPVIEQLRNSGSSGVSKPVVRGGADRVQGNNVVGPSPGDNNGESEKISREAIEKALVKANELAKSLSRTLSFSYDDRIEKVIVKVMEGDGDKMVRQIPPEEMIRLSVRMDEIMGMLIDQNV
jgi:uncharacterized FlaG/YvyC family protein